MGDDETTTRIAIIGSGFAGLGMAIRLKQEGVEDFVVLERADDVGGTWRDNTYPGCACDVPSHLYSFSFAPNPSWTPHLLAAAPRSGSTCATCAERFGVLPHIRFGHEVEGAAWDDDAQRWRIETSRRARSTADVLVAGTGAAARAVDPRPPRPRELRGPGLPLGRVGPRPRPDGRARRRRSAPAPRRSSSCRRSSRRSSTLHALPAHAAVGHAAPRPRRSPSSSARVYRALPGAPSWPCAPASTGRARRSCSASCTRG